MKLNDVLKLKICSTANVKLDTAAFISLLSIVILGNDDAKEFYIYIIFYTSFWVLVSFCYERIMTTCIIILLI